MGCGVSKVGAISSRPKRGFGPQGAWIQDASKRSTPTAHADHHVDAQVQVKMRYTTTTGFFSTDLYMVGPLPFSSSVKNKTHVFHVPPQRQKLGFPTVSAFQTDPHLSLRKAARLFGVSKQTARKAIREIRPSTHRTAAIVVRRIHTGRSRGLCRLRKQQSGADSGERAPFAPFSWTATRFFVCALFSRQISLPVTFISCSPVKGCVTTTKMPSQLARPFHSNPRCGAAIGVFLPQEFSDDELTSPMTHIGKNLAEEGRLSDSIAQILDDMDSEPRPRTRLRTRTRRTSSRVPRRETGVQTVNDL
ncbi:unnamed protein product, partial [Ixodes persulcatus]